MDSDGYCLSSIEVAAVAAAVALVVLPVEMMRTGGWNFGLIDFRGTLVEGWKLGLAVGHLLEDD